MATWWQQEEQILYGAYGVIRRAQPEMGPNQFAPWCRLCHKWVTRGHLLSKEHTRLLGYENQLPWQPPPEAAGAAAAAPAFGPPGIAPAGAQNQALAPAAAPALAPAAAPAGAQNPESVNLIDLESVNNSVNSGSGSSSTTWVLPDGTHADGQVIDGPDADGPAAEEPAEPAAEEPAEQAAEEPAAVNLAEICRENFNAGRLTVKVTALHPLYKVSASV